MSRSERGWSAIMFIHTQFVLNIDEFAQGSFNAYELVQRSRACFRMSREQELQMSSMISGVAGVELIRSCFVVPCQLCSCNGGSCASRSMRLMFLWRSSQVVGWEPCGS